MKLTQKALDTIGDLDGIRIFIVVKDQCSEMRFPLNTWKFLYNYQESTSKGFNEILREALIEYFKNKRVENNEDMGKIKDLPIVN